MNKIVCESIEDLFKSKSQEDIMNDFPTDFESQIKIAMRSYRSQNFDLNLIQYFPIIIQLAFKMRIDPRFQIRSGPDYTKQWHNLGLCDITFVFNDGKNKRVETIGQYEGMDYAAFITERMRMIPMYKIRSYDDLIKYLEEERGF